MSDENSLLKARYCRSILRTASLGTSAEARHLILGLTTEILTPDTSDDVHAAEQIALAAIGVLAGDHVGRNITSASLEWLRAQQAIERWMQVAG